MTMKTMIMATLLKRNDGDISGRVGFVEEEYNNKLTRRVLAIAYARWIHWQRLPTCSASWNTEFWFLDFPWLILWVDWICFSIMWTYSETSFTLIKFLFLGEYTVAAEVSACQTAGIVMSSAPVKVSKDILRKQMFSFWLCPCPYFLAAVSKVKISKIGQFWL